MARLNREAVYQALFDLVTNDPGVQAVFGNRTGRLLPHEADVSGIECPALYTFQLRERRVYKGRGIPPIRTLFVAFVAYFTTDSTGVLPATAINAAADAIDNAISYPGNPDNVQTLGGQVEHVYLEPDIAPYEGLLQDKSVLVAVAAMLVP